MLGTELPAVLPVPGSTAASAVFIGASPMNLLELKRRARARVLPETTEALTREVLKLGDVGIRRSGWGWLTGMRALRGRIHPA